LAEKIIFEQKNIPWPKKTIFEQKNIFWPKKTFLSKKVQFETQFFLKSSDFWGKKHYF